MPLPTLAGLVQQAAQGAGAASGAAFEQGVIITVHDGRSRLSVEVAGAVLEAVQAGDEPFRAGDRVLVTRQSPGQGGGCLVHGYA